MSTMTKKIVFLLLICLFFRSKTALRQRRGFFGIESRWQRHMSCCARKKVVVEDTTIMSQQAVDEFTAQLQELMSKTNIDGQRPNNFKRHERMSENLQNLKEIAVNMTLNTTMSSLEVTTKQRTRKQMELQDEQRMEESRIDLDRNLQRPQGDSNGDLDYIETNDEIVDNKVLERIDQVVDNRVVDETMSSLMNQQDMQEVAKMYANTVNGNTTAKASIRAIEEEAYALATQQAAAAIATEEAAEKERQAAIALATKEQRTREEVTELMEQQQLPPSQPSEEEEPIFLENEATVVPMTEGTSKGKNTLSNPKQKEGKVESSSLPKILDTEQVMDTVETTREKREIAKEKMQQQSSQEVESIGEGSSKVSNAGSKGKRNEIKNDSSVESKGLMEEQNVVTGCTIDLNTIFMVPDPINVASTKARLSLKRAIDEVELLDGFRELMEAEAEQALLVNGSMANTTNTTMIGMNGTTLGINGTTVNNIKLRRLLCPVCTRPCEQKEMDDFGKCSICRADDLEDRTILMESTVTEKEATESLYMKRRKERQEKFAAEGTKQQLQLQVQQQLQQELQQKLQQSTMIEQMSTGSISSVSKVATITATTNATQDPMKALFEQWLLSDKSKKDYLEVRTSVSQLYSKLNEVDYRLAEAEDELCMVSDELSQKKDAVLEKRLDAVIYKMEARILELENKVRDLENFGSVNQGYVPTPWTNESNIPEEYF